MTLTRRLVLVAAIAVPTAAVAHHGWSSFDTSKQLDHTGPVARSEYANPHGTVYFTKDGAEITVELAPVFRMEARGLKPADIAPGQTVRVFAYQNRGNARLYRAEWIEIAGKRIELR